MIALTRLWLPTRPLSLESIRDITGNPKTSNIQVAYRISLEVIVI